MNNSIGNGPCTLINIMTTLQLSFAKKKGFFLGSLYLTTYVIHAGNVLYSGLQDLCQLGK
jgi:hypothetical protein